MGDPKTSSNNLSAITSEEVGGDSVAATSGSNQEKHLQTHLYQKLQIDVQKAEYQAWIDD
jgi:hypothetical protein